MAESESAPNGTTPMDTKDGEGGTKRKRDSGNKGGGEAAKRAREFEEKAKEKEKQPVTDASKSPAPKKLGAPVVDIRVSHLANQDGWMQKKAKLKAEQEAKERAEREAKEKQDTEDVEARSKLGGEEKKKLEEEEKARKKAAESKVAGDEQKKKALIEMLSKGAVFVKYGRKGSPHPREVFLTADGFLYWAKPGSRQKKKEVKYMDVNISQKVQVLKGKQTQVFKARGQAVDEKLCFSVTSEYWFMKPVKKVETRTLDLLCKTEAERNQWADAIVAWREYQQKKVADEKMAEEARQQRELLQKQAEEKAKKMKEEQERIRLQEEKLRDDKKKEAEARVAEIQNQAQKLVKTPNQTPHQTPKKGPEEGKAFFPQSQSVAGSKETTPKTEGEATFFPTAKTDVHKIVKTPEPAPVQPDFKAALKKTVPKEKPKEEVKVEQPVNFKANLKRTSLTKPAEKKEKELTPEELELQKKLAKRKEADAKQTPVASRVQTPVLTSATPTTDPAPQTPVLTATTLALDPAPTDLPPSNSSVSTPLTNGDLVVSDSSISASNPSSDSTLEGSSSSSTLTHVPPSDSSVGSTSSSSSLPPSDSTLSAERDPEPTPTHLPPSDSTLGGSSTNLPPSDSMLSTNPISDGDVPPSESNLSTSPSYNSGEEYVPPVLVRADLAVARVQEEQASTAVLEADEAVLEAARLEEEAARELAALQAEEDALNNPISSPSSSSSSSATTTTLASVATTTITSGSTGEEETQQVAVEEPIQAEPSREEEPEPEPEPPAPTAAYQPDTEVTEMLARYQEPDASDGIAPPMDHQEVDARLAEMAAGPVETAASGNVTTENDGPGTQQQVTTTTTAEGELDSQSLNDRLAEIASREIVDEGEGDSPGPAEEPEGSEPVAEE